MKIGRFERHGKTIYGIVKGEKVIEIDGLEELNPLDSEYGLSELKVLAPAVPEKIICIGLNYRDHAMELNMPIPENPIIFLKPPTGMLNPGDDIIYPHMSSHVDYEAELAVVIGKGGKNIPEEDAIDHILGYTCFNDVTARDLQKKDGQWTRAKSFDTFAPFGPFIATKEDIPDPHILKVMAKLNDKVVQDGNTKNLIFNIPFLISFISRIMTLKVGDILATGTPPGVGPMKSGDKIVIEIEGIGVLENKVSWE